MAQRKKAKKKSWLKTVFFYVVFPLIIWFLAFVAWLYWDSIAALFSKDKAPAHSTRNSEKAEKAPSKRPQEKILDDDRKKLEDILKQRQ